MPQIILRERTAHLGSYTFFTRDVDQYKNTLLSQLYQPTRTPFSQNTYHQLLLSCEYCKVFKNSFFMEYLREQSFEDGLQNIGSLAFRKLYRKALMLVSLFKKLANSSNFIIKKTPTKLFFCEVCEIFNEHLFYRTPPVTASAPPVSAFVFL